MTTDERILHRLSLGATFREDGNGITMDLPGHPTSWTRRDLWDAVTAGWDGAGRLAKTVGATPMAATASKGLTEFLALAGKRA